MLEDTKLGMCEIMSRCTAVGCLMSSSMRDHPMSISAGEAPIATCENRASAMCDWCAAA